MKSKQLDKKYYVYLLLVENGSYYCGYTDDVQKRFLKHLSGNGAKYTRANKPVKIVWTKAFESKAEAMSAEYKIKRLSHENKKLLSES